MFYPADPGALAELVDESLARGSGALAAGNRPARAIVAPHAGYVYSGWLAGAAFAASAGRAVRHAVVLSPSHRHAFEGLALPSGAAFAMPGFDMPLNTQAREALVAAGLAHVEDAAHDREHAAEVMFPFLHAVHPGADVLPIVIGRADDGAVAAAVDFLASALDKPLFVLSSDLSHFLTDAQAREKDAETARLIETGHAARLGPDNACGMRAIRGYLAAQAGGGARPARLAMANSGAVNGDTSRVVGYGAWALYGVGEAALAEEDRATLLRVAREALESRTRRGRAPNVDEASFATRLRGQGAAFVTLTKAGQLRGCIGSLAAHRPLVRDVMENAMKAGHEDPRFAPVRTAELADIHLHIAVLGPAAPMQFGSEAELLAQLRPGEDGLILSDRGRRGTFLPSVWESLPTPEAFLAALKRKAGLAPDYWSDTLTVERYRAESFGEA
jgi:hypothetical protein